MKRLVPGMESDGHTRWSVPGKALSSYLKGWMNSLMGRMGFGKIHSQQYRPSYDSFHGPTNASVNCFLLQFCSYGLYLEHTGLLPLPLASFHLQPVFWQPRALNNCFQCPLKSGFRHMPQGSPSLYPDLCSTAATSEGLFLTPYLTPLSQFWPFHLPQFPS